jgi:uncharacterized repeat protein (TIGR04138 family)
MTKASTKKHKAEILRSMLDPSHPLARLLEEDQRYSLEAYIFLFEALQYAQNVLGMGEDQASEPAPPAIDKPATYRPKAPARATPAIPSSEEPEETGPQRHVSGQELCEAIRRYALHQYGYMAKLVLNDWGIYGTGDFGEIVFNLIRIGQMRKTPSDTRVDFDDIYDFDVAFRQQFKITPER